MYLHPIKAQQPDRSGAAARQRRIDTLRADSRLYQEAIELLIEAKAEVMAAEQVGLHYPSPMALEELSDKRNVLRWAYDHRRQVDQDLLDDMLDT